MIIATHNLLLAIKNALISIIGRKTSVNFLIPNYIQTRMLQDVIPTLADKTLNTNQPKK